MSQSASTSFDGQFAATVHLPSPSASRDDSTQTQHRFIARYIAKFAQHSCPLQHFLQQEKALVPLSLNEESWQAEESLLNRRAIHTISAHIAREATVWRLVHDAVLQCPEHATSLSQHQEGQSEQWLNQLLHYIDQHLHEEICSEQLAERHAMSVSTYNANLKLA